MEKETSKLLVRAQPQPKVDGDWRCEVQAGRRRVVGRHWHRLIGVGGKHPRLIFDARAGVEFRQGDVGAARR